jgi:hypothetical protein
LRRRERGRVVAVIRNRALPILLLPVLALSACGGGGNSEEDKIRDIVSESGKNPSKLCDHLADAPLKALGGKDKCKELAKEQKGQDVKIESVKISGSTATVKGGGGKSSGDLKLAKENGEWKITIG